jgi:E3 ubiquitin-protein ligase SHPRH
VTPPSLASQWADELALHAPTLKVFVYNGWSKLGVPVTQADVQAERALRKKARSRSALMYGDGLLHGGKARRGSTSTSSSNETGWNKPGVRGRQQRVNGTDGDVSGDPGSDTAESRSGAKGEDADAVRDWCSFIHGFDVCITTYNTLRYDFNVARAPIIRPRRDCVDYTSSEQRSRSPLIMCEWYRVIMDEVQMVGGGNTE